MPLKFLISLLFCLLKSAFLVQENQDLLIKCISQNLGFSGGKPVAACIIYKCLLHWRSFEVERTSVFDCIIQTVASAIEVSSHQRLVCLFFNYIQINSLSLHFVVSSNKLWIYDGCFCILLKVPDNNDILAYWLSNSSTLLLLLQHTLKASGAASLTPQRRRTASASLFGRMSQVFIFSFSLII